MRHDGMVLSMTDIRRLHLGYFTRPDDDPLAGERIFVCAYLIRHPDAYLLFDTGIGEGHEEAERLYRPVRRNLFVELEGAGVSTTDIGVLANCHFHLDHCGGNPHFPGVPVFAQAKEYDAAHEDDYTVPALVDFPGARFELHEGEADVLPGNRIIPTPGHVPGHQSLVVSTNEGTVVMLGQAFNFASDYARAQFSWQMEAEGETRGQAYPEWIGRIQEFDPQRVLFAHDVALWEKEP
jgi:glyoxylase-like metal-dependent hydrolase (beta-lactamase superfamily II)